MSMPTGSKSVISEMVKVISLCQENNDVIVEHPLYG